MCADTTLLLQFQSGSNGLEKGKKLCDGLSVVLQIDNTLWVANDETSSLERLTIEMNGDGGHHCAHHHKQFVLSDYLQLPAPADNGSRDLCEVDIEGLAFDNGYLWLVGSHSMKRSKPSGKGGARRGQDALASVSVDDNRYLLARIPVVDEDGTVALRRNTAQDGKQKTAARLRTRSKGNDLIQALKKDAHLAPFLSIPGKDNGFDIEGMAVAGKRLFLGLRGPVLRGWAVILEIHVRQDKSDPSILRMKRIGPDGRRYRKHFLQLNGLGIRDLCVDGSDMLILAGPTMNLDGPVALFRWPHGADVEDESMVEASALQRILDIPFGQGEDHAEGICLFATDGGQTHSLLVVYDAASNERKPGHDAITADVFKIT